MNKLEEFDASKPDDYHFQSMRCAWVSEQLGGVKAEDSFLFERAIETLLSRGKTEDEIVAGYRERFPQ